MKCFVSFIERQTDRCIERLIEDIHGREQNPLFIRFEACKLRIFSYLEHHITVYETRKENEMIRIGSREPVPRGN